MTTQKKLFISLFVILSILTEKLILYLFPFTGLAGLICWPATIIITGLSTYIIYRTIKKRGINLKVFFLTLLFLIIDTFLLIKVHPQDYGGDPIVQISQCATAYQNYDEIRFDKFGSLNKAERVVYINKFQNRLPSSISILSIDKKDREENPSRSYEIFNYSDSTKYDTTKIMLQQNGDFVILTENLKSNLEIKHSIRRLFLRNNGTGYTDTNNKFSYNINKDNFELKSGIEKVFYILLDLTKG